MTTTITTSGQRVRTSAPGPAPQGRIFNHELYELVFGVAYAGLASNLMLVAASLPLVILLLTTDPVQSWPALALCAPLLGPAAVGAFSVFRTIGTGSNDVVRAFWRGWRTHLWRALAVASVTTAVVVIATLNSVSLSQ